MLIVHNGRDRTFFDAHCVDIVTGRSSLAFENNEFVRLYFDTAGTGAWLPAMAAAFNITTPDRIMFGSDYPLECKTAANLIESLDMVRQAPCSDGEKTAMLGKTAAGLFKL